MIDFDNKTLQEIATKSIPAAYRLLPAGMDSRNATVILLAIGLQESRFIHRLQIGGPARGFWQFERGGGVRGVLRHWATRAATIKVCAARQCALLPNAVYLQIAEDDVLAAAFARLLLYSDPAELPAFGDAEGAWALYVRTWRPGKPHVKTWAALYAAAVQSIEGATL